MKKVLVLGSGALKIGQGGEFDFSGSQCLKAMKEEGIKTILINPNIATYQTSEGVADKIFLLPVTPYFVEQVIAKEKPEGILLAFGGQTALNCGLELEKKGVFKRYNVEVLGTSVKTIEDTEDRERFIQRLEEINVKTAKSIAVSSVREAIEAGGNIGYPLMLRAAFALGGKGSGIVYNEEELLQLAMKALSTVSQVLIEEYLGGWKEIEYEVVRDVYDNCITVCNMENFDPMGIHTGESIVVAPSQTLTNKEYHHLREIAIRVIRHLKIIGECNIQYALNPQSNEYRVIEVNARLSRSSALASKATGYPLAFVAAKLSLGYALYEIKNAVTQVTGSCFEPALDYIVVKIPQWDLQKFNHVDKKIGTEMKSVGEVMAIGRKFEETLQKAIRMLHGGVEGIIQNKIKFADIKQELKNPTDKRVFAIAQALEEGMGPEELSSITKIDLFFIYKIQNIVLCKKELAEKDLTTTILRKAKQLGFSDKHIAEIVRKTEKEIREIRKSLKILPVIKQIDTLAGEFPCKTNYLYVTYNGTENDVVQGGEGIIVLGSGSYKIGSSVEFDWCCVQAVQAAKKLGHKTIMINYNPETVSTDYDICNRLYFDELSFERVLDIYEFENPDGVILSMGGQIPNNLALPLQKAGVNILGTNPEDIDRAENRSIFSILLDKLDINQPIWKKLTNKEETLDFANRIGYPLLIRPSYVLSGAAMQVVFNDEDLLRFLEIATDINKDHPVVITQFIENAKEIELDAVAKEGKILIYAIGEHVENAGVHSGDAMIILPAQKVYKATIEKVKVAMRKIAKELNITGPFNIQFLAKDNEIKVIECNLRASRSFPFASKVFKENFIDIATKAILGEDIKFIGKIFPQYVGVKAPQFSFSRLKGADPTLGVEMASTGEVACLGSSLEEATLKSLIATGFKIPKKGILLSTGQIKEKAVFLDSARQLKNMGFTLYATRGTHEFLLKQGVETIKLLWPDEKEEPNTLTYIKENKIDLVINVPKNNEKRELNNDYYIRRTAVDFNVPLLTNIQLAQLVVKSINLYHENFFEIKECNEYKVLKQNSLN